MDLKLAAMPSQSLAWAVKVVVYTVRQSFPEPSGFQYSERTIASTETNDTPAKSP